MNQRKLTSSVCAICEQPKEDNYRIFCNGNCRWQSWGLKFKCLGCGGPVSGDRSACDCCMDESTRLRWIRIEETFDKIDSQLIRDEQVAKNYLSRIISLEAELSECRSEIARLKELNSLHDSERIAERMLQD